MCYSTAMELTDEQLKELKRQIATENAKKNKQWEEKYPKGSEARKARLLPLQEGRRKFLEQKKDLQ